jgi:hypothetical protein
MNEIASRLEYRMEIQEIANSVAAEAEGDIDTARDLAHEAVDGHTWIIYNRFHTEILAYTDNENAIEGMGGGLDDIFKRSGVSGVLQTIAFCAMLADVEAELDAACDEWIEAAEAEREAAENSVSESA